MAATLYLVDGMSSIYRAYHGIQGLATKQGIPTNAVFGFTNMLRKLIVEEEPDYLGIAMDVPGPTFRHELYADYKATRRPMPEDLVQQIPYVIQVCKALKIPVISCEKYEADDVIGTLVRQGVKAGLQVVVVTIDKDMFQLVSDEVTILDTRTMTRLNPSKVEEKFGVSPEKVIDVLSLVGDPSDNIPGAPGIGKKGARQLILEYDNLDNLLSSCDQVSRKSYRESLQGNEALIRQSLDLVTIRDNLPLELNLDELKLSEPEYDGARKLFEELEFSALLEDFSSTRELVQLDYRALETVEELQELIVRIKGNIAGLSLLYSFDNRSLVVKAMAVCEEKQKAVFIPQKLLESCPAEISQLVKQPRGWVIHNLKSLHLVAQSQDWVLTSSLQDTMLMAYLLNPNPNDFSLEKLAPEYLQCRATKMESGEDGEKAFHILCERADFGLQLFAVLDPQLESKRMDELFNEIEVPLVGVLVRMEGHGVKVNCELLAQMSNKLTKNIEQVTDRIYEIADEEFNINSSKQLSAVLFEKLNLPGAKKTRKAGHYATGVEVLKDLAETHEIARLVLDYREMAKLKNTYLDALPKLVNSKTGRIHTSYNQTVAATGRLSSSNPNLQNIPIRSELGREIRRAFIAEPGYLILAADYSQIELRIMAHLSKDPVLVDAFLKGEDIHERTAREVFGMQALMNPRECRRHAKAINFGIMYGLSAFGLAQSLKIDRQEAQKFIDDYFEKYKGIEVWRARILEEVNKTGYVTTLFGRVRPIPEIHSKNRNIRNFGERTAINAPIQGTAADLIKKAMVAIDHEISDRQMKSKLIMQVHDELVLEVEDRELEQISLLVREKMEGVADLIVPLQVDLVTGSSWFEAK